MLNPKDDTPLIFELIDLHLRQRDIVEHLIQRSADEKVSSRLEDYAQKLDQLDEALKKFIDSAEDSFEEELFRKLVRAERRVEHDR